MKRNGKIQMITVNHKYIFLQTYNTSYVIRILQDGTLVHCYYGSKLTEADLDFYNLFIPHDVTARINAGEEVGALDAIPLECPSFGRGDFRTPAFVVAAGDGRGVNDFKYCSHKIIKGKPSIPGLPQTDVNVDTVETLELLLKDAVTGVEIVLSYTVFFEEDVIARHTTFCNCTEESVSILVAASATVDFETAEFDMVSLAGRWSSERNIDRYSIHHGEVLISSRQGLSGHHLNPFAALVEKETCEDWGKVYGFALVYSGDFKISAEVSQFDCTRVWIGINPETFTWELNPGETFDTPEVLLTYTDKGFSRMTANYHKVSRNHLGVCAEGKAHPIVLNLWEAFEFDISEEVVLKVIDAVKDCGIDVLVIDDGWFGNRRDETSSLGDWFVNCEKFPRGLNPVVEACRQNGMHLGLWFEPETVSRDSKFYSEHPEWCVHIPGVPMVEIRSGLALDFSCPEVIDAVYDSMYKILSQLEISYVKWDMNRSITDNGSTWLPAHRQKEHGHRRMLGIYALMSRLQKQFPHIFFEGCASGGGRFDFGMLYYMPQIWTSDNTDALERMKIQYGTSLVYPPETISAHVSECPNVSTGRITPFQSRCDVAQMFSFGYELDPNLLSDEEKAELCIQSARHREIAKKYKNGSFYRLRNPFDTNACAWQLISDEGNHSIVFYGIQLKQPNYQGEYLKLKGLDDEKIFRVEPLGITCSGRMLKCAGIPLKKQEGDFYTIIFELTEISG